MPTLNDIFKYLVDAVTPNEVGAEMIPQTPGAKAAVDQALAMGGPGGDVVRALHARPEKINVTDQPDLGMKLFMTTLGRTKQDLTSPDYTMRLNPDLIDHFSKRGKASAEGTVAHEAGHIASNLAGIGGTYQPTGIGLVNRFSGWRLPKDMDEDLADAVVGNISPTKGSELEKKTRDVLKFLGLGGK